MSKKNIKHLSMADMSRILDVPVYRIQYLFLKRKLKREDFPYVSKFILFRESDVETVRDALASIKTFTWSEERILANNRQKSKAFE